MLLTLIRYMLSSSHGHRTIEFIVCSPPQSGAMIFEAAPPDRLWMCKIVSCEWQLLQKRLCTRQRRVNEADSPILECVTP
jgi:hypothetical protein